jgi:copper chaperone NosL
MKLSAAVSGGMNPVERILFCSTGVLVLLASIIPLWRIDLRSPQYPEGLHLVIHPQHLTGNIQSVNILNHYIGMKPLSDAAFPEFTWMMPVLCAIGVVLLLLSLIGRRELALFGRLLLVGFDGYMAWDLYHWLYDWGHNLDPRAPITVPPFTPPLFGAKQIANFFVVSYPSWGGACIMIASFLVGYTLWYAVRRSS